MRQRSRGKSVQQTLKIISISNFAILRFKHILQHKCKYRKREYQIFSFMLFVSFSSLIPLSKNLELFICVANKSLCAFRTLGSNLYAGSQFLENPRIFQEILKLLSRKFFQLWKHFLASACLLVKKVVICVWNFHESVNKIELLFTMATRHTINKSIETFLPRFFVL